jgi:proteasome lid subunit RPN8/RPN11
MVKEIDITLAPGILEQVIQHATDSLPDEACGLLVGRNVGSRFVPIANIAVSTREYEMNPSELISTIRSLRDTGEQLIAIVHSHPHGPAEPSKTDVDRAYYPEAAHLIVSLATPERPLAAGFRIIDGEVIPIEVHVIV